MTTRQGTPGPPATGTNCALEYTDCLRSCRLLDFTLLASGALSEYTWGVMNHLACGHLLQQPWEMDTSTNSNFMFYFLSFMKKGKTVAQTEAKANKLLDGVC